jgi:hypothetical protein
MSKTLTVDLRTRFIPETNREFIVFPGEGYRYYQTMEATSTVFLDVPGFPLPETTSISKATDLVARVVISDLVREWHRKGRAIEDNPSRDPQNLKQFRATKRRKQLAGMLENLFARLKRGDVVVVPPRALEDEVLYGEIDSEPDEVSLVEDPLRPGEFIPARKVRWLARQSRMNVPGWLERKLPNQNPIRQVEKSFHKYIYDYMYERYFYDGQFVCKFRIEAEHFSSLDDFLIQQMFLYTAALYAANQEGKITDVGSQPISIVAAGIEFSGDIPDQRIFISSPGNIFSYAKNVVPLIAGALISLSATVGVDAHGAELLIVNSADQSDISKQCQADIAAEVMDDMKAMGYDRWKELCAVELRARQRTKVDPGMSVANPRNHGKDEHTGSITQKK